MKKLLKELVDWLESAHAQGHPCGFDFEQSPHTLAWADAALELSSQHPVVLYTRSSSARAVVSGLVLLRAGVKIENVYSGDLDDESFARLTMWLARMSKANLVFFAGLPAPESMTRQLAGGRYVFCC